LSSLSCLGFRPFTGRFGGFSHKALVEGIGLVFNENACPGKLLRKSGAAMNYSQGNFDSRSQARLIRTRDEEWRLRHRIARLSDG
jgi:hypothetical protein